MKNGFSTSCAAILTLALISGCGGGGGSNAPQTPQPTFTVGGSVSGLTATGLVLRNGAVDLPISSAGSFVFAGALASGSAYNVSVATQPTTGSPMQVCNVVNGSGTVSSSNITNVAIDCVTAPLTVASSSPASGAVEVDRSAALTLTFSAPINAATANGANITLVGNTGNHAIALAVSGTTITVTPQIRLLPNAGYSLIVSTAVRGTGGEQPNASFQTGFTTRDGVWQTAQLIDTDNAGDASAPEIAVAPFGTAHAVWYQFDGVRNNIWSSQFVPLTGWAAAAQIENDNVTGMSLPRIAVDSNGNAISVWQQSGGGNNILANRFGFGLGGGWGAHLGIDADPGFASVADVKFDSNGNAIAVWRQTDGVRYHVMANRYVVGIGWGLAVAVEADNTADALSPRVAVDPAGNAIAVWYKSDGTRTNIWANRYTSLGWGTPALIETDNAGDARFPEIGVDSAGNAIVVWQQSNGSYNSVWANRYSVATGWGTAVTIESQTAYANTPDIAIDRNGNAIAVWTQGNPTRSNIWMNRYSIATGWGTESAIETGDFDSSLAKVAIDPSGNALAVWQRLQQGGAIADIWASRFNARSGWSAPAQIETDNAGTALNSRIVIDSRGNALAVWMQSDGIRTNIWANRFD